MVASENLIVCNNFIAQHKEFMQCAIKTRKLKLGSTQNAIYTIPFYYTLLKLNASLPFSDFSIRM